MFWHCFCKQWPFKPHWSWKSTLKHVQTFNGFNLLLQNQNSSHVFHTLAFYMYLYTSWHIKSCILHTYFNLHVCPSVRRQQCLSRRSVLHPIPAIVSQNVTNKVVWYVLIVKNMHPGSPPDPSGTAAAEAKPRCVLSILKPHGQSSRCQVRLLPPRRSRGAYTQF